MENLKIILVTLSRLSTVDNILIHIPIYKCIEKWAYSLTPLFHPNLRSQFS